MNMPFFRNDAEAGKYAAQHRPYDQAFGPVDVGYARRHGARAADAAARCKEAAACGDMRALYLAQKALSTILFVEKPELFEQRAPRKENNSPWPASSRPSNFPSSGTKLDGRVSFDKLRMRAAHGEKGRAA